MYNRLNHLKAQLTVYFCFVLLLLAGSVESAPFFDKDPDTVFAPVFPGLNKVDERILSLCGVWGSRTDTASFTRLLKESSGEPWLAKIYDDVYLPLGGVPEAVSFHKWLARIWTNGHAVTHIFCGEPGKQLGGLHYFARYWQAQEENWAWLMEEGDPLVAKHCKKMNNRTAEGIYTLSVGWNSERNGKRVKCVSGYHLDLNADEILLLVTRAYAKALGLTGEGHRTCLFQVQSEQGYRGHFLLLVVKNGSIRTSYPLLAGDVKRQRTKGTVDC